MEPRSPRGGRRREQRVQVDLGGAGPRRQPVRRADLGMQLAGVADDHAVRTSRSRRSGPGARVPARRPTPTRVTPSGRAATSSTAHGLRPAGRLRPGPCQPGARQDPVSTAARCRGWSPSAASMAASSSSLGRPVTGGRGAATAGSRGVEHRTRLERGPGRRCLDWCCGRPRRTGREAAWSAGTGAVSASGLAIRFSRRRRSSAGTPELVELVRGGEREAEHLDETGGGQRRGDGSAGPLGGRQPAADRRPGHERRRWCRSRPADRPPRRSRTGRAGRGASSAG